MLNGLINSRKINTILNIKVCDCKQSQAFVSAKVEKLYKKEIAIRLLFLEKTFW